MRAVTLCLVAAILTGCGVRKLIISHGDTVAQWYVDDLFDLNAQQKAIAEKEIAATWQWMRCDGLHQLAANLGDFVSRYRQHGLDPTLVDWTETKITLLRKELSDRVTPGYAGVLLSLNSPQWQHYLEQMQESAEERTKLLALGDEEFVAAHREAYFERLSRWYGQVDESHQEGIYMAFATTKPNLRRWHEYWLGSVHHVHRSFVRLAGRDKQLQMATTLLSEWLADPITVKDPAHRAGYRQLREGWKQRWLKLDKALQNQHRKFFVDNLASLQADLSASALPKSQCPSLAVNAFTPRKPLMLVDRRQSAQLQRDHKAQYRR